MQGRVRTCDPLRSREGDTSGLSLLRRPPSASPLRRCWEDGDRCEHIQPLSQIGHQVTIQHRSGIR